MDGAVTLRQMRGDVGRVIALSVVASRSLIDNPLVSHELPDTSMPRIDPDFHCLFGHPWAAVAACLARSRYLAKTNPYDGAR